MSKKRHQEVELDEEEWVSKTELKRQSAHKQKLGRKLVEQTPAFIQKLQLDESLEEAILLAQRIRNTREGYRRQLQFVGKLMRNTDTTPIEEAFARLEMTSKEANAHFHLLEKWRDRIIAEADPAIQAFLEQHPNADRQRLRQLARQAKKEAAASKPPKAARELFKELRSAAEPDAE